MDCLSLLSWRQWCRWPITAGLSDLIHQTGAKWKYVSGSEGKNCQQCLWDRLEKSWPSWRKDFRSEFWVILKKLELVHFLNKIQVDYWKRNCCLGVALLFACTAVCMHALPPPWTNVIMGCLQSGQGGPAWSRSCAGRAREPVLQPARGPRPSFSREPPGISLSNPR